MLKKVVERFSAHTYIFKLHLFTRLRRHDQGQNWVLHDSLPCSWFHQLRSGAHHYRFHSCSTKADWSHDERQDLRIPDTTFAHTTIVPVLISQKTYRVRVVIGVWVQNNVRIGIKVSVKVRIRFYFWLNVQIFLGSKCHGTDDPIMFSLTILQQSSLF